jgi:hypothetical protein
VVLVVNVMTVSIQIAHVHAVRQSDADQIVTLSDRLVVRVDGVVRVGIGPAAEDGWGRLQTIRYKQQMDIIHELTFFLGV